MSDGARIKSVEARSVRIPLDSPTSFSTRVVNHRDYVICRIETMDGARGIGFCYGGSDAGDLVAHAVRELLAPLLVGEDATRVEGLWDRMYSSALLHARAGSTMRAISILDNALWDRNARSVGMPLHRFLGGYHDDRVPAYASGGYYLDGKGPEQLAQEMASYVASGFKAVKMKVGRLGPSQEEDRIRAAREAIGPDVLLMLDANNAWRDLPTALRFMDRYEDYNPYWIEEPFSPDDIDNHVRLAERTRVPVATGEIEAGRWRFKEILDRGAAQILQTDACVCGGISEYRRISATAASYGINVCPHWFHDLHIHLVGSTPNGEFVEFFPDDQVLNFRRLIDRQVEMRDGDLMLPTAPGLGFDFDDNAIDRYALEAWS